jgi:hypothetical protein
VSAVRKNISITEEQEDYVQQNALNLSKLVQGLLSARMAAEKEVRKWQKRRRD